jgi:diguanylate cyclase
MLGTLTQTMGVMIAWLLFGATFNPTTTPIQIWACLPILTLYPWAVGIVCYRLAIKLSEHKRALSALSRTDSLTGLLNHGAWKDLLHLRFDKCREQPMPVSIALIDIDHFKAINDTYGHIVGDSVLRRLSRELQLLLRDTELIGRCGGDEFCAILPNMPLHQATEYMERLRDVFANYRHRDVHQLRVSLSIGLAPYQASFPDAAAWLDEADKALYTAKNTGRNKTCVATDSQPAAQTSGLPA